MSIERCFTTPELLLMICENLPHQRDVVSVMKISKTCHIIVLPLVWYKVVGVENLLRLLSGTSELNPTIPASVSRAARERFSCHAGLVRHLQIYARQENIVWEGFDRLKSLNCPITPDLRVLEFTKKSGPARAVQDLNWVKYFAGRRLTSLRVTSNTKDGVQLWTADDLHGALSTIKNRGASLTELGICAKDKVRMNTLYPAFYECEKLLVRFTAIARLSLSVYQVDLKALDLCASLPLRSFHVQGFGGRPLNWGNLAECDGPFENLTELCIHNLFPADTLILLRCYPLVSGLLSVSLSFSCELGYKDTLSDCMECLATSCGALEDVAVEFHKSIHYSDTLWLSPLGALPLRHLSVCQYSMSTAQEFEPFVSQWPLLRSLSLPNCSIPTQCIQALARCPDLARLTLLYIDSGAVPTLVSNVGENIVVNATFRLKLMSNQQLEALAR
ncbi:hypothetical protein BDV93DRAFT_564258 [Ceratobasidium sp. AG-I]|nr:hypothetical protein BDV93DRAFT_564258 [Ceratobasidium sp. AG-I]